MIKLQDFARECGVTDRAIQKHLKNHENELAGHFERRGKNGTWLDEFAQDFIRKLMIQQPIVIGDNQMLQEHTKLQNDYADLQLKYEQVLLALNEAKDVIIDLKDEQVRLKAAEQKQQLLEEGRKEDKAEIQDLKMQLQQFEPTWFGLYRKKS